MDNEIVEISSGNTFRITWKINRFCNYCARCNIKTYESRSFEMDLDGNECFWYFCLENYFSKLLFKCVEKCSNAKIQANLKFSTINSEGLLQNIHEYKMISFSTNDKVEIKPFLNDPLNCKSTDAENTLTIVCEFSPLFIESSILSNYQLLRTVSNDLRQCFCDEKFSDLTLIIDKQEIRVHKVILASRSPVFLDMLNSDVINKKNGRIEITDIDFETMEQVLLYMYTGKVEKLELASKLLGPADKYALDGLKNVCAVVLSEALTVENCVETLKMADLYCVSELKTKVVSFMSSHFNDVTKSADFESLLKS